MPPLPRCAWCNKTITRVRAGSPKHGIYYLLTPEEEQRVRDSPHENVHDSKCRRGLGLEAGRLHLRATPRLKLLKAPSLLDLLWPRAPPPPAATVPLQPLLAAHSPPDIVPRAAAVSASLDEQLHEAVIPCSQSEGAPHAAAAAAVSVAAAAAVESQPPAVPCAASASTPTARSSLDPAPVGRPARKKRPRPPQTPSAAAAAVSAAAPRAKKHGSFRSQQLVVAGAAAAAATFSQHSKFSAYSPGPAAAAATTTTIAAVASKSTRTWRLEDPTATWWRKSGESWIFRLHCSPPIIAIDGRHISHVIAKRYRWSCSKQQEDSIFSLLARPTVFTPREYSLFVRQKILRVHWPSQPEQQTLKLRDEYSTDDDSKGPRPRAVATNALLFHPKVLQPQPRAQGIHLMFFEHYSNTMDVCLHAAAANGSRRVAQLDFMYDKPRMALFWESSSSSSSSGCADERDVVGDLDAMERASCSLLHHLFQNLAAHHRVRVLLGDIKPANIFFSSDRPRQPVFGDYGHAAHMPVGTAPHSRAASSRIEPIPHGDQSPLAYTHHMQSTCELPEGSSFQDRLSTDVAAARVTLPSLLRSLHPEATALMGFVAHSCIGTRAYQAPETLVRTGCRGVYTAASDAYSLAASMIEILLGYTTCMCEKQKVEHGGRLRALQAQCDELKAFSTTARADPQPLTKRRWQQIGSVAVVPPAVLDSLRSLLLPPCGVSQCNKHGSVQQLLAVISSYLETASVDSTPAATLPVPPPQASRSLDTATAMEVCGDESSQHSSAVSPLVQLAAAAAATSAAAPPFFMQFNDAVFATSTSGPWDKCWQQWDSEDGLLNAIGHLNVESAKYHRKDSHLVQCTRRHEASAATVQTLQQWWSHWTGTERQHFVDNAPNACATYAFDLELPVDMLDGLLRVSPHMRHCGPTGYYTLEQYLPDAIRDTITEGSTRRLRYPNPRVFFCPPVQGMVHTTMHADGRGDLASMHLIPPASNPHMRNRVASANFPNATCADERQQKVLNMDLTCGSVGEFSKFRYSATPAIDASMLILPDTNLRKDKEQLDDTLKQLLQSPLLKLHLLPAEDARGQRIDTLVQPPASAHRYEKERTQGADGEPGHLLPVGYVHPRNASDAPLIGVQCASTILGHNKQSTTLHLQRMQQRIQQYRVQNIALCRKGAAPVRMQNDLVFFFGLFVTDQWHRPTAQARELAQRLDNIDLLRLQQQHRRAMRPFIDAAVKQELEHFNVIASATVKGKALQLQLVAPSGSKRRSAVPAVHCHCSRCDADIFFYQYLMNTPGSNSAANVCGQCAVESPYHRRLLHSYTTRFPAPQGLDRLWATTLARLHWKQLN